MIFSTSAKTFTVVFPLPAMSTIWNGSTNWWAPRNSGGYTAIEENTLHPALIGTTRQKLWNTGGTAAIIIMIITQCERMAQARGLRYHIKRQWGSTVMRAHTQRPSVSSQPPHYLFITVTHMKSFHLQHTHKHSHTQYIFLLSIFPSSQNFRSLCPALFLGSLLSVKCCQRWMKWLRQLFFHL